MPIIKQKFIFKMIALTLTFGMSMTAIASDFTTTKALAERGNIDAQVDVGRMYRDGEGIKQDYAKAAMWFQKAADRGDAAANFSLGRAYHVGEGVKQDYKKAAELIKKSADQNYPIALGYLGTMYETGQGVPQNKGTAKMYYGKVCDIGISFGCELYQGLDQQGY